MEPEDIYGKSTAEALNLDRSREWGVTALEETSELTKEYANLFAITTLQFLREKAPGGEVIMRSPLAEPITMLCLLFLKMGYLKGKQAGEDRAKLEGIWKED